MNKAEVQARFPDKVEYAKAILRLYEPEALRV